jgi:hypothetical protein
MDTFMLLILIALIIIVLWCIVKFCNYFIECLRSKHALHGIKMNDFILFKWGNGEVMEGQVVQINKDCEVLVHPINCTTNRSLITIKGFYVITKIPYKY